MEGLEQERRGVFGGIKAPFDLNGVILAFVAVIFFIGGVKGIGWFLDEPAILERIVKSIDIPYVSGVRSTVLSDASWRDVEKRVADINAKRLEAGASTISLAKPKMAAYLSVGAWALILWAFFGGAIGRIMAMRIARDEGLEIGEALKFGGQKFLSNLFSILTVGIAITFLYIICNTILAGWFASIPVVGELLLIPMYPLIFLSCLIIILLLVPLVFGFTLMSSAIATESSDSFDGMSRAFSYVYSRPWQVVLFHGLTFATMAIFLAFALLFLSISVGSLRTKGWGLNGSKAAIIAGYVEGENKFNKVKIDKALYEMPGSVVKRSEDLDEHFGLSPDDPVYKAEHVPVTLRLSGQVIWGLMQLAWGFVLAYLVAYWFSANQAMYFILRRDVDGEDPSEIYIEEEKEEEPYEVTTPDRPAGAPPAAVTTAQAKPSGRARSGKRRKTSSKASGKTSARKSSRRGGASGRKGKKSGGK